MKIPYNWLKEYVQTDLTPKEVARFLTMAGHALDKPIFEQEGDAIMDLEDRGNRADITGIVGVARDLAALTESKLKEPNLSEIPKIDNGNFKPEITVESDKVTRWRAIVFKNVKVSESPRWLSERLKAYGLEPKNNIVDITNFVMVELGMPLHAFDLARLDRIILRRAKEGERLTTFEDIELKLDQDDLVAANNKGPLTLTTAIGGKESGVTPKTKDVLIEAGLYDQPTARKSALKHNVRNETSNRLGKYLHPHYCEIAIARVIGLMDEVLNAKPENLSFDYFPKIPEEVEITLTQDRMNLITGENVSLKECARILEKLGFLIEGMSNGSLIVKVPYYRTDIFMEDDVIEEVLRIRGYEKVRTYLPNCPSPKKLSFDVLELEDRIRDIGTRLGFNEIIGQQIIDLSDLRESGYCEGKTIIAEKDKEVVTLENSWNKELNSLRPSLFFSMIRYLISYQKHNVRIIKLLECGKTYLKNTKLGGYESYVENREAGFLISGGFLTLKGYIQKLATELGLSFTAVEGTNHPLFKNNIFSVLMAGEEKIGIMGQVRTRILSRFGFTGEASFAELDLSKFCDQTREINKELISTKVKNYLNEDITLKIPHKTPVGPILIRAGELLGPDCKVVLKDTYKSGDFKSVTLNIRGKLKLTDSIKDRLQALS